MEYQNTQNLFLWVTFAFLMGIMTASTLSPAAARDLGFSQVFVALRLESHVNYELALRHRAGSNLTADCPRDGSGNAAAGCTSHGSDSSGQAAADKRTQSPLGNLKATLDAARRLPGAQPQGAQPKGAQPRAAATANPSAHDILAEIDAHDSQLMRDPASGATEVAGNHGGRRAQNVPNMKFNGQGGVDPQAIEAIRHMNIPDAMKREILDRYRRTGVMPRLAVPDSPAR